MVIDFKQAAVRVTQQIKPHQIFIGHSPEFLDGVKFRQVRIVDNILL